MPGKKSNEPRIRPMEPGDWPAVAAIYEEGILTGNATFQTEAPSYSQWDESHLPFARLVAEIDGAVVGWTALSPTINRHCYRGVAEISIYIAGSARGMGVGGALLDATIAESEANGVWTLTALIFPENEASMALHQRHGFVLIGVREKLGQSVDGTFRDVAMLDRRSAKFTSSVGL